VLLVLQPNGPQSDAAWTRQKNDSGGQTHRLAPQQITTHRRRCSGIKKTGGRPVTLVTGVTVAGNTPWCDPTTERKEGTYA